MRISDWSSDVCSSDLAGALPCQCRSKDLVEAVVRRLPVESCTEARDVRDDSAHVARPPRRDAHRKCGAGCALHRLDHLAHRSEEHTSELQSLMRISYAVFCLQKKKKSIQNII